MLFKLLQPEKALLPIVFSLLPVTTVFKLVQLWKAPAPMDTACSILTQKNIFNRIVQKEGIGKNHADLIV